MSSGDEGTGQTASLQGRPGLAGGQGDRTGTTRGCPLGTRGQNRQLVYKAGLAWLGDKETGQGQPGDVLWGQGDRTDKSGDREQGDRTGTTRGCRLGTKGETRGTGGIEVSTGDNGTGQKGQGQLRPVLDMCVISRQIKLYYPIPKTFFARHCQTSH